MQMLIAGDFSLQGQVVKCHIIEVLRYLMGHYH